MLLLCVTFIVLYSVDLYQSGIAKHTVAAFSAAGFVMLTIPISLRLVLNHLSNWNRPSIQKHVVRIIWMIPLYSIESFFALKYRESAIYIRTFRESYESYVIYNFLYYLIALLGNESQLLSVLKTKFESRGIRHMWPVNYFLPNWTSGEILNKCKIGVLQYVVVKNAVALLALLLHALGSVYREGDLSLRGSYIYCITANNCSQFVALYCLLLFYFATKDELSQWRPIGKFLCVKGIIFFTFWQQIAITFLVQYDPPFFGGNSSSWTVQEVGQGLQDYLICLEMLVASIAFTAAFTHKDYALKYNDSADTQQYYDSDTEMGGADLGEGSKKALNSSATPYFFHALVQSSVPHDFFSDLHKVAQGKDLLMVDMSHADYKGEEKQLLLDK